MRRRTRREPNGTRKGILKVAVIDPDAELEAESESEEEFEIAIEAWDPTGDVM